MILNVYKPKNWTSFDVVAKVKGILRTPENKKKLKVGHAGTLDPLAEGVLIVLTQHDTKKQDLLMHKPKEYIAEIAFGAESVTYDLEGTLTYFELPLSPVELRGQLETLVPAFIGEIEQRVPAYSATKIEGNRLYKLSRQGEDVSSILPVKKITIHEFEILDFFETTVGEKLLPILKCRVVCSSGTYLRSIAHDLGERLGTGGVLKSLVRSRVGEYTLSESIKIENLPAYLSKHPPIV